MRFDSARPTYFAVAVLALLLCASSAQAQGPDSYVMPNETISGLIDRDPHYDRLEALSPDGDLFMVPVRQEFSSLELMSQRTLRLGMLELCPDVNREWRLSTYGIKGLRLYSLSQRRFVEAQLPEGILISDMTWSPDGKRIAFLAHLSQGSQVWTLDAVSGRAQALNSAYVMATLSGRPQRGRGAAAPSRQLQWTADGSGVLALLVPDDRGAEPRRNSIPSSPIIRRTRDKATPTRTQPFLLRTPHDEALFRYYTTSQLALLRPGQAPSKLGKPAMYMEISLSPDGRHILAEKLVEPFSYIASYSSFPRDLFVMDMQGNELSTLRKVPLQEALRRDFNSPGSERDLPREVSWRPDGKGLSFLWREEKAEKDEDGEQGDESSEDDSGPRKDRLMTLAAPFDLGQAQALATSEKRFSGPVFSRDGRYVFVEAEGREQGETKRTREIRAYDLNASPPRRQDLAAGIDPADPLKDPGEILSRRSGNGVAYAVVSDQGPSAFLGGDGYREDLRPRPFIDRVAIADGGKERVFESSAQTFDQPLAILDDRLDRIVMSRESPSEFPNSFLRNRDGSVNKLTDNQDPFPEVASAPRTFFKFKRRDGLTVQARFSVPPDYTPGNKVPAIFWTYPREFESPKAYKRATIRRWNLNRFHQMNKRNASDIWLTQGYAVVEPDIPIIGKNYNNNYIAHLVDSMHAAIRRLDKFGIVDIDRMGHGGHSYGAFATANILAHSPFFKAGIAGDGAFNRTLTPMSFQRERRFIWEAQDIYLEMSPFFVADRISTPLLMYHGEEDNNSGTYLIQSERMIQALTGLGKTAVLYVYPFESHGPRARETYMDLWARWSEWFDKYVMEDSEKVPQVETNGRE